MRLRRINYDDGFFMKCKLYVLEGEGDVFNIASLLFYGELISCFIVVFNKQSHSRRTLEESSIYFIEIDIHFWDFIYISQQYS